MRLDTSLLDGIGAAKSAATSSSKHTQKSSGSSFSSALKAATSTGSSSTTDQTAATDVAETTRAVPGHLYAEILTGPRAGMYINTSHNVRSGQTFVMVHRNGVELHVYGTGKNRHVVEMRRHSDPAPSGGSSSKTTTTAPTASAPATATTPAGTTTTAGKIVTDTSSIN